MEKNKIYEKTLFAELSSFELKTKDDIQELTKDDIDRVLRKVRDVRLRKYQGSGQGQEAIVDEDLAKGMTICGHRNIERILYSM